MSERPALRALATRMGIELEYESALDGSRVAVGDATLDRLLAAMGHGIADEKAATEQLARLDDEARGRPLAPLRVVVAGSDEVASVALRAGTDAARAAAAGRLAARLRLESGETCSLQAVCDGGAEGEAQLVLPDALQPGHHEITITLQPADAPSQAPLRQALVVVPQRAPGVADLLATRGGGHRGFGLQANLYAMRSPHGVGHGSLGDLRELSRITARHGGCFVAISPLHASSHAAGDDSPYSPIDRLHLDPLYLEIERVPELSRCPTVQRALDAADVAALRDAARLDRPRIWALLRPLLETLFDAFERHERGPQSERRLAFERDRAARGDALRDYAAFVAIAEWLGERGSTGVDPWDWRTWPAELRASDGPAVGRFRDEHARQIDFHAWLQWELTRQLDEVVHDAREAGLALGPCLDLPLGSRPGGVETWREPTLFACGVEVGAPPDEYAPNGQLWGFPPMIPTRLVDGRGHRSWLALIRASLAHAGALRIDHAMSLRRLFWVPEGASPSEGAYVRAPERELLGMLALESRRAGQGAVLIGEDLGTVPEGFSDRMRARGLLSTRVLYFERDEHGYRPTHHYPEQALVTANTHDLAPLAAWCSGSDLALRRRAGQLADDTQLETARRAREADRSALEARLREDGHLAADEPLDTGNATAATARFLAATPAALVALSLDDLAGETEPINLPGATQARHPSWQRRSSCTLPEAASRTEARDAISAMVESGRALPD